MNRRRFLREGLVGGALAAGAGGFLFARRSQARAALTSSLVDEALPPLTANSYRELNSLPARARGEIQRFFHGKCLDVRGFVTHVCSDEFAERLGRCRTPEERETCFLLAFCGRIATAEEILFRVETIAAELGSELDSAWGDYCARTSGTWNTHVRDLGPSWAPEGFADRVSGWIRGELEQAARQAISGNRRPAVGETIGNIGQSAVLLLPLLELGPPGISAAVPVFFLLAAKHVWDYASARLEDRRGDYQAAISGRLALLGNRVGTEFEREVRLRLTDLHAWQERAVRDAAGKLAEERVRLL
jgi:hypothetical protein